MSTSSAMYTLFAACAVALIALSRGRWRMVTLLAVSAAFYVYGSVPYALGLLGLGLLVWRAGVLARQRKRWALVAGIVLSIGVLGVFKYTAWAAGTLNAIGDRSGAWHPMAVPSLLVPLGISFIVFGLVHYLVEMWKGEAPQATALEFLTYVFFFPTVTSGPIKRYPAFIENLRRPSGPVEWADVRYGSMRIVFGLVKKIVLADTLAGLTGQLMSGTVTPISGLVLAIYAFTFQIWLDFSGYSDIAIGISRILGFKIIENFDRPYLQPNISEFWRHWHMSLTRFITEYVFIPLGGSRVGRIKVARNTMISMGLSGLWHGAAWHYVVWGLYHGVGLVLQRWFKETVGAAKRRWPTFAHTFRHPVAKGTAHAAAVFITFNFVALGWVLFAVNLSTALKIFRALAVWAIHRVM
jgi:alginate O-acetyltransferase complex protein AlgI